jgi:peroxidase
MSLSRWFTSRKSKTPIRKGRTLPLLELLEARCTPTVSGYRPIDEVGNNVANPGQGTADTDLIRVSPVAYADGIDAPSLPQNPSARVISDILNNQTDPNNLTQDLTTVDGNNLSDFGYAFGQFMDHDMDLTPTDPNNTLLIAADPNDPSGMAAQTFDRSLTDPTTGTSTRNPAQDVNAVTSYLDLSQVYGSTDAMAAALRTGSGGLLKTSAGNMLPYDNSTYFTAAQLSIINMANDAQAVPTDELFVTGDVRGNENVELTALQTLFVRNHNRIATELQQLHPGWTDEQLYQEARKLNIAEYQEIIYNDYLPDLLGKGAIPKYTGYNPNVNASIATEFSTVAFRFGHSMLDNGIDRNTNNGLDLTGDPAGSDISLATDFFDPNVLNPAGVTDPLTGHVSTDIGAILKGDADGLAEADDIMDVDDIRDLLFGNGGLTDNGQDLIARDVERARDDGIGSYNQVREAYGLAPVTSFAQITSNVQVQQELQEAYGSVNNIDPFEGGMAEDHVGGSDMGPLFTKILVDQFTRLETGDRYFYLNETMNPEELAMISQGNSLGKIIEANTNVTNLQSDVFVFQASISGTVSESGAMPKSMSGGLAGITVDLKDSDGDVVASTVTNARGQYSFNQPASNAGVDGTGSYTVSLELPAGVQQTSADPAAILISRGGTNVGGVNFTVTSSATQFAVNAPKVVPTGKSFDITVVAEDASGNLAAGYTGTVRFSLGTMDAGAVLPTDYTFTAADHGVHTFHVTLSATGSQTIIVTDTTTSSIVGQAKVTAAAPGLVTHFALIPIGPAIAGSATQVLVVALDAFNNIVTNYTGTVHLTSSDSSAKLPADYTFTTSDHGSHLFSIVFGAAGDDTLTATDTKNSSITGSVDDWVLAPPPTRPTPPAPPPPKGH